MSIRLSFTGTGSSYAPLWFKNLILRFLTLNFYYPWAKAATLRYQMAHTEIDGSPLEFQGTGKQMFRGYLVAVSIIAVLAVIAWGLSGMLVIDLDLPDADARRWINLQRRLTVFTYCLLLLTFTVYPLALHGTLRYRLANIRWRGIRMGYSGKLGELYWIYIKGALLTIVTLGIGQAWMTTWILKYVANHARAGHAEGMFTGKGAELFIVRLKRNLVIIGIMLLAGLLMVSVFFLLMKLDVGFTPFLFAATMMITLVGIGYFIIPWAVGLSFRFLFQNSYLYLNDLLYPIESAHATHDFRMCYFWLPLLQAITLGFATPWTWTRTQSILLDGIRVDEEFPLDTLLQVNTEYTSAIGEDLGDAMDLTGGLELDLGL